MSRAPPFTKGERRVPVRIDDTVYRALTLAQIESVYA
jgi:hypothetical protein